MKLCLSNSPKYYISLFYTISDNAVDFEFVSFYLHDYKRMNTRWLSSVMRDDLGDNSNTCRLFEVYIDLVKTKSLDEVVFILSMYIALYFTIMPFIGVL